MNNYPDKFLSAVEKFQSFLKSQNWPEDLQWIKSYKNGRFFINWLISEPISESDLEKVYEFGKKNYGAAAYAIGIYKQTTIAQLIVPDNDTDAQYSLIGPLNMKFGVPAKKIHFHFKIEKHK